MAEDIGSDLNAIGSLVVIPNDDGTDAVLLLSPDCDLLERIEDGHGFSVAGGSGSPPWWTNI